MLQRRHSRWVDMHMLRPKNELKPLVEQLMYRCDDVAALVGLGCAKKEDDMGLVEIALGNIMASEKQIQRKNSRVMEWLDRTTSDPFATEIASGSEREPILPLEDDPIDWDATRAPTPTSDQGLECSDASDREGVAGESSGDANGKNGRVGEKSVAATSDDRLIALHSALSEMSTRVGASPTADANGKARDFFESDPVANDQCSKVRSIIKDFEVLKVAQSPACTPRKPKTPRVEMSPRRDPSMRQGLSQALFTRTASEGDGIWRRPSLASSTEETLPEYAYGQRGRGQPKLDDSEACLAPPVGAELVTDADKMPVGLDGRERGVESVLKMLQLEVQRFESTPSDAGGKRKVQIEGLQDFSTASPILQAQQNSAPVFPFSPAQPSLHQVPLVRQSAEPEEECYEIPSPLAVTTNAKLPALTLLTKRPSVESNATVLSVALSPNHDAKLHESPDGTGRRQDLANESVESPAVHAWTICVPQAERRAEEWHVRTNYHHGGVEGRMEEGGVEAGDLPKMSTSPSDRFSLLAGGPSSIWGAEGSASTTGGLESILRGMQDILNDGITARSGLAAAQADAAPRNQLEPPREQLAQASAPSAGAARRQDEATTAQPMHSMASQTIQAPLSARHSLNPPPFQSVATSNSNIQPPHLQAPSAQASLNPPPFQSIATSNSNSQPPHLQAPSAQVSLNSPRFQSIAPRFQSSATSNSNSLPTGQTTHLQAPSVQASLMNPPRFQSIATTNPNSQPTGQPPHLQAPSAHAQKPPAHPQSMTPRQNLSGKAPNLPTTGVTIQIPNTGTVPGLQQHGHRTLQQQPQTYPAPMGRPPASSVWQQPQQQRPCSPMQRPPSPGCQQQQQQRPSSPGWPMGQQRSFPNNASPSQQTFPGQWVPSSPGLHHTAHPIGMQSTPARGNMIDGTFRNPAATSPMLGMPFGPFSPSPSMQQWPGRFQAQQPAGSSLGGAFM